MDDITELIARARATQWGPRCSALWAEAAQLAENHGLIDEALHCYLELVTAYAMGGESTRVIAPFSWCNNLYQTQPELFDDSSRKNFAWAYKYVLSALIQVPSVPADKCENVLADMKTLYRTLGDNLGAVYIREYKLLKQFGNHDKAEQALHSWRAAGRSEFSDCEACDPMHELDILSNQEQWEQAYELGEQIFSARDYDNSCDAQPGALKALMLLPWLHTGHDDKAWAAHIQGYRNDRAQPTHLDRIAQHLTYLAHSGRSERALRILHRHLPWWDKAETPEILMELAIAAAHTTRDLPPDETFHGALEGETLPWKQTSTLINPTNAEAHNWFARLALEIAALFDAREGITAPHTVNDVTRRLDTVAVAAAPDVEKPIPDITGILEDDSSPEDTYPPLDIGGRAWLISSNYDATPNTVFNLAFTGKITLPFKGGDEAYQLLAEAAKTSDPMKASQLADQAIQTPTNEPIGLRLTAYKILGDNAHQAGYLHDAIEFYRSGVNLAAACGIIGLQGNNADDLCRVLNLAKRHHEAAEVAETTLMALEANQQLLLSQRRNLRHHLIGALSALGLNTQAAEQALILADNEEERIPSRCENYEQAAHFFVADGHYEHAKNTWQQRLTLTHPDSQQQAKALYQFARCIADQPGAVPEEEIATMENLMDELHTIVTSEGFDEHHSPEWHHAEWLSDKAYMHWHCNQQTNAIAYMHAAADAFHAINATAREAKTHLNLGYMHVQREEHDTALGEAYYVVELLSMPQYFGNSLINEAKQLINYLTGE